MSSHHATAHTNPKRKRGAAAGSSLALFDVALFWCWHEKRREIFRSHLVVPTYESCRILDDCRASATSKLALRASVHVPRAQNRPWFIASVALFALCFSSGCASYRFGNQSLHRPDIRTVYVPMIESDSLRRNLGERLTEAVVKEIELNTPYKIVASPDADSTLQCRLLNDRKKMLALTRTGEPRDVELDFQVQINWSGRRGEPLIQRSQIPLPSALYSVGQDVSYVPEAGQSAATAQQEAIQRLAKQIREQLETAW